MQDLTLVIPAKYESESLPIFLNEIVNLDCKKLIVLESEDTKTINSINAFVGIELLFQNKKGYGAALTEGISNVLTPYFCIINADGSMDPKYLFEMLDKCKNNDLIFATRYEKPDGGSDDDTIVTLIGNKIFSFLGNFLFDLKISDILYTYILGKTISFKKMKLESKDFRLCVEIPIKAKKMKLKYLCLPSYERCRIAGVKKVNAIKDGFLILLGILSFIGKKY